MATLAHSAQSDIRATSAFSERGANLYVGKSRPVDVHHGSIGAFTARSSTQQSPHHHTHHQQPPSRSVPGMASFRQYPYPQHATVTGSQDSLNSSLSGDVRPSLKTTSSNISTTTLETGMTSPVSPVRVDSQLTAKYSQPRTNGVTNMHSLSAANHGRLKPPDAQPEIRRDNAPGSPMSVSSPVTGVKRTAGGDVKSYGHTATGSPTPVPEPARHQRAGSGSSSNSRAGEAAAQLKMRLGYAMAKVQNGWEHRSMAEVEQLAARLSPRTTISSPHDGRAQVSPRYATTTSRPHIDALPRARLPMNEPCQNINSASRQNSAADQPMSPPSKRRSVTYGNDIALAPPAEIGTSFAHRRTSSSHRFAPPFPSRVATSPRQQGHQPSTPKSVRRLERVRTETQTAQDEQDAMDGLMLMGSPSNGGRFPSYHDLGSQTSSTLQSPRHTATRPTQALQYRTHSNESVSRASDGQMSSATSADVRDRNDVLDQIEAEA